MDPYIDGTYCAACYGRLIWSFQGTLKLQSDSEVSPIRHHENVKRLLSPLHPAFNVQVVYNIWTNRLQNLYIHYTVIVIRHWVQLSIDLQWSVVVCQANCFQWNHRTLQLYQGPYSHPVSPCSWTLRSSARKWPGLKEKNNCVSPSRSRHGGLLAKWPALLYCLLAAAASDFRFPDGPFFQSRPP